MNEHIKLGKAGEKTAYTFLKRSKYKILEQDLDLKIGEIIL